MTERSAVVTGAGRGIGEAVARRLANDGYRVVALSRTGADVEELAREHEGIVAVTGDAGDEADVERAAAAAAELGHLAAWANNAAVLEPAQLDEMSLEHWRRTMRINLDGVFLGCRAAFARMRDSGGAIINIASLSGVPNVEKFPGRTAYNVSKAGVIALTEAVALEGKPFGIRCICLSPGAVDTRMLRQASSTLKAGITPDDVAAIVAWLVTSDAAPLTGTNIPIFSNA